MKVNEVKLLNCVNGKLYKKWNYVHDFYGGILASKKDKLGNPVELLITENNSKRILYNANSKTVDISDKDGFIKKTYIMKKSQGYTVGKMLVSSINDMLHPLILGARWISDGFKPKEVQLEINSLHKGARLFITNDRNSEGMPCSFLRGKNVVVKSIIAKDFGDDIKSLPKTIIVKTADGRNEVIKSSNGEDNYIYANHFGLTDKSELGQYIRTIV